MGCSSKTRLDPPNHSESARIALLQCVEVLLHVGHEDLTHTLVACEPPRTIWRVLITGTVHRECECCVSQRRIACRSKCDQGGKTLGGCAGLLREFQNELPLPLPALLHTLQQRKTGVRVLILHRLGSNPRSDMRCARGLPESWIRLLSPQNGRNGS